MTEGKNMKIEVIIKKILNISTKHWYQYLMILETSIFLVIIFIQSLGIDKSLGTLSQIITFINGYILRLLLLQFSIFIINYTSEKMDKQSNLAVKS